MARPRSLKPAHCHNKAPGRGDVTLKGKRHCTGQWGTQAAGGNYGRRIGEGRSARPATSGERWSAILGRLRTANRNVKRGARNKRLKTCRNRDYLLKVLLAPVLAK